MVSFLSSFLKDLRKHLIPKCKVQKKINKLKCSTEYQKHLDVIKKLLVTQPVLCIHAATDKFRLESNASKTAGGAAYFQMKQGEWVLSGYYLKNNHKKFKMMELQN